MQPFRYLGEWIFCRPQDIQVERFIGWRRAGKRRLFQPFAILRIGEYRVCLDGKDSVWEFICAIQPDMPKAIVIQGMKGEFVQEQTFAQDLQDFARESKTDMLSLRCEIVRIAEPNSTSMFSGYMCAQAKAQKTPKCILSFPQGWGEHCFVYLPMRVWGAVKWLPSLVMGDYPHLVIAQSLSESRDFDLQTDVLISSVVLGVGDCADMRPHATLKRSDTAAIISAIAQTHDELCNRDFAPSPCNDDWRQDRTGMLFKEADDIQHMRAERQLFSLPRNN